MASPNEDQEAHDDQQLKEAIDGLTKLLVQQRNDGADDGVHDNQQLKAVFANLKDALSQLTANASGECNMQLIEAAAVGWMDEVVKLLDQGADVNATEGNEKTALMLASYEGHAECVQLLLERGAQTNRQDKDGLTALMVASYGGHVECVNLLLDRGAQVNQQNKDGHTALHVAVMQDKPNHAKIVKLLLSQLDIDPSIKNKRGHSVFDCTKIAKCTLDVFIFCNYMADKSKRFPADKYGKVVLCGHSGAGKSTLTQDIINISKSMPTRLLKRALGRQDAVEPLTAGIIPHQVDSSNSNMIIYDLAGQQHYFSSHSACLEAISLKSPAIFLLLQDLTKPYDVITKEVYYWSAMIDGVCHKCPQKSSVIVVGTHADLLTPEQVTTKLSHLQSVAMLAISNQKLVRVVALNLKAVYSDEMGQFKTLLQETNKEVVSMGPSVPFHCNLMLAYLKGVMPSDLDAISLSDLLKVISNDPNKTMQPDMFQITPLLTTLSEKGLILFIPSEDPSYSWIVLHKEVILQKVNGALFADPNKHSPIASSTGIICTKDLMTLFPQYNIQMLIQVMIQYELCQQVDLSQVKVGTNMAPGSPSGSDLGPLLFFPALIRDDRPNGATVPNNSFGWSMIVKSTKQFFTPRFLHVLLRRLPFEFAFPTVQATPLHSHLNRRCDVWSRGVKWVSETGVTTMVEMNEMFQSLSMAMSFPEKTDLELAHRVLAVIKKACQEFCPHVEVLDVISCPPEASSDHSDDTKVELSLLKKALPKGDKCIVDVSGQKHVVVGEWLKIEPCLPYLVGVPSGVVPSPSELAGQAVPQLEVSTSAVSSSPLLSELVCQTMPLEGTPTMPELLSFSDEKLNVAVQVGAKYSTFGIFLLEDKTGAIVEALEIEHLKNAQRINMAILQQWLQGKGMKPLTWSALIDVLRKTGL